MGCHSVYTGVCELRRPCRRVFPYPPQALAVIDCALWDLAGKAAGLPVYKMLGGAQSSIKAYTSTPMLGSVEEYLEWVQTAVDRGFQGVKFHW
jgi:L-alanine-DL-glutamate epimerase-like enolase superfamily enzyme